MGQSKSNVKENWSKFSLRRLLWFFTVMVHSLFVKWSFHGIHFEFHPYFSYLLQSKYRTVSFKSMETFYFSICENDHFQSSFQLPCRRISIWIKSNYRIRIELLWISIWITNLIETVYIHNDRISGRKWISKRRHLITSNSIFQLFFYVDSKQHLYQEMGKKKQMKKYWNEMNNC